MSSILLLEVDLTLTILVLTRHLLSQSETDSLSNGMILMSFSL